VLQWVKHFIETNDWPVDFKPDPPPENLKRMLLSNSALKRKKKPRIHRLACAAGFVVEPLIYLLLCFSLNQ
jgi:hypothetical protein